MAESTKGPGNSKKIGCRSRQVVKQECTKLLDDVSKCLKSSSVRSDEVRLRYMQKFKEIFEKVIQENLAIEGMDIDVSKKDETPEFEVIDREKEAVINQQLIPELDDLIVKVANKRKYMPRSCYQAVRDFSNSQAVYMAKVKPLCELQNNDSLLKDLKSNTSFVDQEQLKQPCSSLSELAKRVQEDKERASHLSEAISIEVDNSESATARAVAGVSTVKDPTDPHRRLTVPCMCRRKRGAGDPDLNFYSSGSLGLPKRSTALGRDLVGLPDC